MLEHCNDPKTQQIVMDEIMQSVCMLAQDQYGNYVVQVCNFFLIQSVLSYVMGVGVGKSFVNVDMTYNSILWK